jgi:hypothetical protein
MPLVELRPPATRRRLRPPPRQLDRRTLDRSRTSDHIRRDFRHRRRPLNHRHRHRRSRYLLHGHFQAASMVAACGSLCPSCFSLRRYPSHSPLFRRWARVTQFPHGRPDQDIKRRRRDVDSFRKSEEGRFECEVIPGQRTFSREKAYGSAGSENMNIDNRHVIRIEPVPDDPRGRLRSDSVKKEEVPAELLRITVLRWRRRQTLQRSGQPSAPLCREPIPGTGRSNKQRFPQKALDLGRGGHRTLEDAVLL